jgi:leader peptidase (prepilin peptidase) / N-methyltransferase
MATAEKAVEAVHPLKARSGGVRAAGWVAASACSAVALARFGLGGEGIVAVFFVCVLVVISVVDIERRIIPNRIVLPATALVLAAQTALAPDRALEWSIAAIGAALFLLIPLLVYPAGMGMGDVKLALLLGAGLGRAVVPAFAVAFIVAAVVGLAIIARGGLAARKTAIPFGPFLAAGGIVALLSAGEL